MRRGCSVVVPSSTDGPTGGSEEEQRAPHNDEDDPDRLHDGDLGYKAHDQEHDSQDGSSRTFLSQLVQR
jgi:hypothetical protein